MNENKKIVFVLILIILLVGVPAGIYYFLFSGPGKEFEVERFVVPLDVKEEELISRLKEQGYIRSEWAFRFVLEKKGWEGRIKPGAYKISKTWNAWLLTETLVRFRYQNWVVIPEGLRKEEIAEVLQEKLYWKDDTKEEFLNYAKEGHLFPDTYLLDLSQSGEAGRKAAERMENQFNEKVSALFKEAQENDIRNDTLIILASLIQREAGSEEEMPLIASVIWNRWLKEMRFEIDATVQYALGKPDNWWPIIKIEDYKFDSLYNTYLHKGRPPGPICSPGLTAVKAVIYPEETEYLFYLHDREGTIHPAKTYQEHQSNIEQYLKKTERI